DGPPQTSAGSESTGGDDTGGSSTTSDEATDGSGSGSTTTAAVDGSTGEPLPPMELEVEAHTYPNQPMVVDLAFSAPELEVSIEHASDPGIRAAVLESTPEETWVRVRGLAPETEHALGWAAQAADGRTDEGEVMVTTETALPGFVPSFTIDGPGGPGTGEGFGGFVLFDLLALTPEAPASL